MKKALGILQNIGIVTGALVTLAGVFWYLDSIQDNVSNNTEMLEYINAEQSLLSGEMQGLQDSLDRIIDHQKVQDEHMADMESAARFYIHNQKKITDEAMEDALELFLKKNDPWSLYSPPYPIPRKNLNLTCDNSTIPWNTK
jgi:hypothetical protein